MASIIRIKRSSGTAKPASLNWGEMAYVTGVGQFGGVNQYKDRVFLGDDGTNVNPIAGHYYTSMMEHSPGALAGVTNSRNSDGGIVAILDSDRKIDLWNVDNLTLDANTLSSSNTDGDIIFDPNGTGDVMIPDDTKLGFGGGADGASAPDATIEYDENGADQLTFAGSDVRFNITTQSNSKDTGSVITEGGLGVEKNLNVGGNLNVTGLSTFSGGVIIPPGQAITIGNIGISSNRIESLTGGGNQIFIDPFPSGLSNEGDVIIKGNLQVDGTTTNVNSTTVTVNDAIMKVGDVTSKRTVMATVSSGTNTITVDSVTGLQVADVIAGTSIPNNTTISAINTGTKVVTLSANVTAGISTSTQLTITHAKDTNTDRGISFNYNISSGVGNNKLGFFGMDDSATADTDGSRKWTYVPDATNTAEVISGTKGYLDIKGIYYQSGDFATHGIVYFTNAGLQTSTTAPSAATFTSTQLLTAVTEVTLTLPSAVSVTAGDQITQAGGTQQGVVKSTSNSTTVVLIGVTGTFGTSADIAKNGATTSVTPSAVSVNYTNKPVWTTTIDGGTF